ncbi:serine/threonine-protein kinase [Nocardiopsis tropica]|uniref:Serine/threonine-protein kinase n=1 Tax=Nocardiopsis tropica TaxID=109330 RepID=A0ABV1ZTR5_9ACTN
MSPHHPPFPPLLPGDPRTVGGYRTVGRLGSGGMGAVYAAADPSGRLVAVKLVHADLAADRDFRARFHREASLVQRVVSPCVPRFVASDTRAAQPWLATEYVPGPTLRRHVDEHGPLSGAPLHAFATGVAEALRAVHAAGVVHRDLKPGNVVLSGDGPKVLDFGIARALHETAITRTGGLFGTPGWVAPELLRGAPPGPAADVFAWGGLVAFAATGRAPFGAGSAESAALRVLEGEPDLDGVPENLLGLVRGALARDPGRRLTVPALLAGLLGPRLDAGAGHEETTALVTVVIADGWEAPPAPAVPPPPPTRPSAPPARRAGRPPGRPGRGGRPWTAVGAALAALVLVVGGSWYAGDRFGRADQAAEGDDGGDGAPASPSGELAVTVPGDNVMMVLADPSGGMGAADGFAGWTYEPPEGFAREDHAIATMNIYVTYLDTAAMEESDGLTVSGDITYLPESGGYTLRSDDITLYEVGPGLESVPEDPDDGREGYRVEGRTLAELTPSDPTAEFSFDVPGAPSSVLVAYRPDPGEAPSGEYAAVRSQGAYMCGTAWTQISTSTMDGSFDGDPCPTLDSVAGEEGL